MVEIVIILGITFLAAVFLAWLFIHRSKEKERMLLIEKGVDLSDLPERESYSLSFPWLKLGCVIIGIAVGIVAGTVFDLIGWPEELSWAGLLFFGGIGLIVAYYVDKPTEK